jgi:hypothetical protein
MGLKREISGLFGRFTDVPPPNQMPCRVFCLFNESSGFMENLDPKTMFVYISSSGLIETHIVLTLQATLGMEIQPIYG